MSFYLLDNPNPNGKFYKPGPRTQCPHGKGIHLIVVHTAENLPDWTPPDQGAEKVARYASTTTRSVSWHATVDSDSIIEMLPDSYVAYHVRSYNYCSLGVEIATAAARWVGSPWEWREAILLNTARVVATWCKAHDIPVKRIDRVAANAGLKGIVAHADLDPERRTDPGGSFPWDWFLARVLEFVRGGPTGKHEAGPLTDLELVDVRRMLQWWKDR